VNRRRIATLLIALAAVGAACGSSAKASSAPVSLRLGFFPNLTHATALVGVDKGIFTSKLPANVTLETKAFTAGPAAIEALLAGAIDATYIGPNPTVNAFVQSNGSAVRIISGATSGGAFLVVKPGITAATLKGKKLATPQLGNTQDVALRTWLKNNGLSSDSSGGGDVSIKPQDNSTTLDAFKQGTIDGAWVPEPWATRLVQEGGGTVLVDERDLWPQGRYVTTQLIVATSFLDKHPDVVKALLEGQYAANAYVIANPADAQAAANAQLLKITGKALSAKVIAAAWANLTFTNDPIASSLKKSSTDAVAAGLLKPVDLTGIYDLKLLNEVLAENGQSPVAGL
jgi:NitT/TauT family transport system substrate-binding protein